MGCWLSGPWNEQTLNGRSLTHLSQRDALQILAAAQHPITMQIKSQRRGQKADHTTSWEPLPLGLQHLNLPRSFYSQLPVPPEHCDPRFAFMSSSPRDTLELGLQDPELNRGPKEPGCLDCCGPQETPAFTSQPDEDDFLLDAPMGYLPLHHELDSGLGWTDGSVHQGELSGLETEEGGMDECLPRPGLTPGGCTGMGGSPSSESFISSELSDSGFYSVSTGEFRHFQRLLEKRMRLYNARLQLQNEPCERRERRDSCPKSHLLEAIPESLPIHRGNPDSHRGNQENLPLHRGNQENLPLHRPGPESLPPCPQHGHESDLELPQRGLFRVSSVQFHKSDRPSLNRHSSSSGALFNPAHSVMSRLNAPVLSTCSTPSSHRRALMPHGPPQPPPQPLRRSRTLHYRPPQAEYRRRASHPASPSYYTLHQCPAAAAMLEQHMHNNDHGNMATAHCCDANANYEQYWRERSEHSRSIPDNLVMEREREQHLLKQKEMEREMERLNQMEHERQRLMERERHRLNHLELEQKLEAEQRRLKQSEAEREKEKRQKEQEQKEERERQTKEESKERERREREERERREREERERREREERERREREERERREREERERRERDECERREREERERREREEHERRESNRQRFRNNNSSFSQSGEANDTWPKPASRSLQHSGGSRGAYSTLDAPTGAASGCRGVCGATGPTPPSRGTYGPLEGAAWDMKKAQMDTCPNAKLAGRPTAATRVSRSQMLRDRASQLADERSGMSTDEETSADMLLGRYWSRTERKEHFLLARELRQQQQARGDRSSSRERERSAVEQDPRANTVLELSHRKLTRLRNRKLLDDWTTVEELLTHGSRLDAYEDALSCPSALLTVTTV